MKTSSFSDAVSVLPNTSGVYKITNISNGFTYVGSAVMQGGIKARLRMHYRDLVRNKHHSWSFQRDWNKTNEADWTIDVLFLSTDHVKVKDKEQEYLNNGVGVKNASYNILGKVDMTQANMPEEVKQKISTAVRETDKLWTTNTSGYRGVCLNVRVNRWSADITRYGVRYHIGNYDDKETANDAYLQVAALNDAELAKWWEQRKSVVDKEKRGENNKSAKLSDAQVVQIRTMWASGKYSQEKLATLFSVSKQWIWKLVRSNNPKRKA